ncbi:glyoxylase-like metal-dependent hydrolase (beta-lactamase superfamily II) [Bradyrhizobium sp. JR7.2]
MTITPSQVFSRRRFCSCCVAGAALSSASRWLSPSEAFAEARGLVSAIKDAAAVSPIVTHKLRNNISVLEGSGGNIAVLAGADGKVLVDAGIGISRPRLARALEELGPGAVTHVINTHWHFDHSDGNTCIRPVRRSSRMKRPESISQRCSEWKTGTTIFCPHLWMECPAKSSRKSTIFNSTHQTSTYGGTLPHTLTVISPLRLPRRILFMSATRSGTESYPFIDYSTGGSIDGMIAASDANLAATTDATIIVPGHGKPIGNRSELKEFREMLVVVRDSVATLKERGLSRDETVAARPTAAFDDRFGNFVVDGGYFTKLVYEGV